MRMSGCSRDFRKERTMDFDKEIEFEDKLVTMVFDERVY